MAEGSKPKGEIPLDMSPADTARELERLREEIRVLKETRTPESAAFSDATEIHAGKNDDGNDMWFFRIDLPPSGGQAIVINGTHYFHREQYKFDTPMLQSVKDIQARAWKHDEQIKGSNENAYRRPMERVISGQGGRR